MRQKQQGPRGARPRLIRRGLGPARPAAERLRHALIAEPVAFAAVAGAAGAEQLVFGSDWPFAARFDGRSFGPRVFEPSAEQREALGTSFSSERRAAIGREHRDGEFPGVATSGA